MAAPARAWVGLGSNLGDSIRLLTQAAVALHETAGVEVQSRSSLYSTPPWGRGGQPDFINAAVVVSTELTPLQLLAALQAIETRLGRVRTGERWGPRLLDLDLLLYGRRRMDLETLQLPHPRMHERAFVLLPMLELQPDLRVPGLGPARELLKAVDQSGIRRLEHPEWPRMT